MAGITLHGSRFAPPLSARFPPTHPSALSATCSRLCLLLLDPICLILVTAEVVEGRKEGKMSDKSEMAPPWPLHGSLDFP